MTDSELARFKRRVKQSGMSQGDYLRSAALNGEIRIEERSVSDLALLDEVALIRAELGRQGGLLKMIIRPNDCQRLLAPAEWDDLVKTIRSFENIKKRIAEVEVKIQHGNSQT